MGNIGKNGVDLPEQHFNIQPILSKTSKCVALVAISSVLISCGGGSCDTGGSGGVSLTLTAPNQYPAGSPTAINAFLTLNNTSNEPAVGLQYSIPAELNTTGVNISVLNDGSNPCKSLPAHSSCQFPVVIGAKAHAGSFGVSVSGGNIANKLESLLGLKSSSTILTTNIGLTDVAPNYKTGADGITFLYNFVEIQNPTGITSVMITAVVGQNAGGLFDDILLTDENGTPLNFSAISGNTGAKYTNLNAGAVVTLVLQIPAGQSSIQFYAKTKEDGKDISQGTIAHTINLAPIGNGILSVVPTNVNFTPTESVVTLLYKNIGTNDITNFKVGTALAPMIAEPNSCPSTLMPNSSCTVVLKSNAGVGASGTGSFASTHTSGTSLVMNYNYVGVNPESGFALDAVNDFNFIANTVNHSESTQVTLTNLSTNTKESAFDFSFNPNHFTISTGIGNNACTVSGSKIITELQAKASCNFTLTYNNPNVSPVSMSTMTVNYKYHGDRAGTGTKTLTYSTTQAKANLSFTPLIHNFGTIVANDKESVTFDYRLTNSGPDKAINVTPAISRVGDAAPPSLPFTISTTDCPATLSAGSSCNVKVKYGPTSVLVQDQTETLTANYKSETNPSEPEATNATATGSARAPISANPVVTKVDFSPSASGGDGVTRETAFAIEQNTANQKVTLTYKNDGNADATNFTIAASDPGNGYTYDSGTCNNYTLQKNRGNSCTMTYSLNTATLSLHELLLDAPGSWSTADEGAKTGQSMNWVVNGNSIIFVDVYERASVTAQLLDGNNIVMTAPYQVNVESTFNIKFVLTGGYNVGSSTFKAVVPSGFITYPADTCIMNGSNTSCEIQVTAPSIDSTGNQIQLSGTPTPVPSLFDVDVVMPALTKYLFVSQSSPSGDMFRTVPPYNDTELYPNGIARADAICQHDAESTGWIPDDKGAKIMTWKALLVDGTNRSAAPSKINWVLEPNTLYKDIRTDNKVSTTNESGFLTFPLMTYFGESAPYDWSPFNYTLYLWSGLYIDYSDIWSLPWTADDNNCLLWSNGTAQSTGSAGVPFALVPVNDFRTYTDSRSLAGQNRSCDKIDSAQNAQRIICVSQ